MRRTIRGHLGTSMARSPQTTMRRGGGLNMGRPPGGLVGPPGAPAGSGSADR